MQEKLENNPPPLKKVEKLKLKFHFNFFQSFCLMQLILVLTLKTLKTA